MFLTKLIRYGIHQLLHSTTVQLSILFTFLSTVLLTILGASLVALVSWQLQQEDIQSLTDFSSLLKADLAKEVSIPDVLSKHLSQELSAFHYHRYQVRIVQADQQVLFESEDFPSFLNSELAQLPVAPAQPLPENQTHINTNSRQYIATAFQSALSPNQSSRRLVTVYVTLNVSQRALFINRLEQALFWIVALGSVLFSVASIALIRKGFEPLSNFRARIQLMSLDNLHTRLGRQYWTDELRPLAQSFDDLMARIEHGVTQLNHFSSDLAHELKTPVTNLRLETEILLEKERTVHDYQESLRNNLDELERLSVMIERLLLLARMDKEAFQLNRSRFSLRQILDKVLSFYGVAAQEKEIFIDIQGDAEIEADQSLIEIVLGNLLSNAIKYTPEQGHVAVRINTTDQNRVKLSVSDTGPGIAEADQAFVFDRFYRADRSRSKRIEGHGLGLSIAKAVMQLHHGQIVLQSLPSEGTTFELTFPASSAFVVNEAMDQETVSKPV